MSKLPGDRLPSGILLKDALDITHEFLAWYVDDLQHRQPSAIQMIRQFEDVEVELPLSMDDLRKSEEELNAEFEADLAKVKPRSWRKGKNE